MPNSNALRRSRRPATYSKRLSREPVTLLFAARDETRNNAVALKEWLDQSAG